MDFIEFHLISMNLKTLDIQGFFAFLEIHILSSNFIEFHLYMVNIMVNLWSRF